MKIAIAQINCTVGDLPGNASTILDAAERARAQGADLMSFDVVEHVIKGA